MGKRRGRDSFCFSHLHPPTACENFFFSRCSTVQSLGGHISLWRKRINFPPLSFRIQIADVSDADLLTSLEKCVRFIRQVCTTISRHFA